MKRKSIISLFILCMGLGMFTTSCEDMLTPDSERHAYEVGKDTLYSYWGIIKSLQNIAERYVILNECRGDLVSEIEDDDHSGDSIKALLTFGMEHPEMYEDGSTVYTQVKDYYHVINSCNAYIAMCDTARLTGTNRHYMYKEYAQILAVRAWLYMQLTTTYGKVPFVDKPMLTTAQISEYMKNPTWVTSADLADLLAEDLEYMEANVERSDEYGFPSYDNYGDVSSGASSFVCHSQKVMFPISIVLGDLYLLANQYDKSADAYYRFLNYKYGGPIPTSDYCCTPVVSQREDVPRYVVGTSAKDAGSIVWREGTNGYNRRNEAITCIPSNKGRLDGKVLTEVNRLFGWEPRLSTASVTSNEEADATTIAGVSLTLNYERELGASNGYIALCDSQKYEIYQKDPNSNAFIGIIDMKTTDGVRPGDARRAWIYDQRGNEMTKGSVYTKQVTNGDPKYGTFISKQNPNGSFTTTFPMVYRKSMVWLRFAEAINRMGYPSIAFTILRDGLCSNENWFPGNTDYMPKTVAYYVGYKNANGEDSFFPTDWKDTEINADNQDEIDARKASIQEAFDALDSISQQVIIDGGGAIVNEDGSVEAKFAYEVLSYKNYTNINYITSMSDCACPYVNREEKTDYLNRFTLKSDYMKGIGNSRSCPYKEDESREDVSTLSKYVGSDNEGMAIGIHQHGCGFIQPGDTLSSYNYVDMVCKKAQDEYGVALTMEEIYDGSQKEVVQNAVEDLILDEMGLELAFEGTRFTDIYRIAKHRANSSDQKEYLAKRIAKRYKDEGKNKQLYDHLIQSEDNWFLKLPK